MIKVNFYSIDEIEDEKLKFAVIMARYKNKWIYVKAKKRSTLEIPGGHREEDESIYETASRELYEETGAKKFDLRSICIYSVERGKEVNYTESFGALFLAEVSEIGDMPEFEMESIKLVNDIPENLTYPFIQPFLHARVRDFIDTSMNCVEND